MFFRRNLGEDQKKRSLPKSEVFFRRKLGEDQKKKKKKLVFAETRSVFFRLNHSSRGIRCYILLDFVGLFPLINHPPISMRGSLNLDGGTLKLDGGTSPPSPLQFKCWMYPLNPPIAGPGWNSWVTPAVIHYSHCHEIIILNAWDRIICCI